MDLKECFQNHKPTILEGFDQAVEDFSDLDSFKTFQRDAVLTPLEMIARYVMKYGKDGDICSGAGNPFDDGYYQRYLEFPYTSKSDAFFLKHSGSDFSILEPSEFENATDVLVGFTVFLGFEDENGNMVRDPEPNEIDETFIASVDSNDFSRSEFEWWGDYSVKDTNRETQLKIVEYLEQKYGSI